MECSPTQKRAVGTEPPPALKQDRPRGRRGPVPAAGDEHRAVGRPRPDQQHHAPALPRAALADPQRARHRPRRPRQGDQRGRSAAPTRRSSRSTGAQDPGARRTTSLANLARNSDTALAPLARERTHVGSLHRALEPRWPRRPPSGATTSQADIERLPALPATSSRRRCSRIGGLSDAGDAGVRRPRRERAGHQPDDRSSLGPFSEAGIPAVKSLGDASVIGTPAVKDAAARSPRTCGASPRPRSPSARPRRQLLESFQRRQGHRAPARLRLLPGGRHQRLRLVRPLPARAPDRQHVLDATTRRPVDGLLGQLRRPSPVVRRERRVGRAARDPVLRRTAAALQGKDPDSVAALPQMTATPQPQKKTQKTAPKAVATPAPTPAATPRRPPRRPLSRRNTDQGEAVLDYLFGKDDRMRGRGSSIAGNPVLIGAATVLVVLVAVFLSYNANQGLPFVPDLPAQRSSCRAPPTWSAATRCGSAARASARSTAIKAEAARRTARASPARPQARARRRAAAEGLDGDHPPALGARPQVRRDHARHARDEGFEDGDTIPLAAARPTPVEFDEFMNMFDETTRDRDRRGTSRASATRSPAAARASTPRSACCRPLLRDISRSRATCRPRDTHLRRFFDELGDAARIVAPAAEAQAQLFVNLDTTFTALDEVARPFIQDSITEGPADARPGDRVVPAPAPVPAPTPSGLFRELRPGAERAARRRRPTSPTRSRPARARCPSTPAVQPPPRLAAAGAAATFANDPLVPRGIKRLTETLESLNPTLQLPRARPRRRATTSRCGSATSPRC